MNPLLSLSFLSSGHAAAGAEPAVHDAGAAMDETAGATNFGRLLNQSGEHQQTADRQSFAGFSIVSKSKRAASMEGQPTGRPDQSVPPVIPPEAELILADGENAGALLGLLDLASQTRLQLTTASDDDSQAKAQIGNTGDTVKGKEGATETPDGKKVLKGEWFILPVYPETTAADVADSDDLAAGVNKVPADGITNAKNSQTKAEQATTALLSAANKGAADGSGQSQPAADGASHNNLKGKQQNHIVMTQAGQALANQAAESDLITVKSQSEHADGDQIAIDVDAVTDSIKVMNAAVSQKKAQDAEIDAVAKLATKTDGDKVAASGQTAVIASTSGDLQAKVSAQNDAEILARQQTAGKSPEVTAELAAELKAAGNIELAAVTSPNTRQMADPANSVAQATEVQKATISAQSATTTIFENAEKAASASADGKPGSSLASAAAVAESQLARQQQRAGTADSINQTKQALQADTDTAGQQPKVELGLMAGGARADSALSGFGSIISPAGQSPSDAVLARMDAAAVAGAQQTAERAKAQSVNKSVTEQLKQVNLLAQNAAGQLKERINLMVRQNIHVAEIRLDPADLGQMQIRVNMQQEQASVQFIVQQQHAKELLEQQMPRLREMLQQQGIQLGEGHVQQQRQGDSQASAQRDGKAGSGQGDSEQHADEQATAVQLDVKLSERIVDYYA